MIKSCFDTRQLSVKVGTVFSKLGIPPNIWTVMALLPALLGLAALYYGYLLHALILFFISGAIDAIDGSVARVTGGVSELGAFLDGVIDRYVEMLLYLGLLLYIRDVETTFLVSGPVWIILLTYGALMPTYIRAYADHRKVVTEEKDYRRMGGLLERAERLTLLYLGMLLGHFNTLWLIYIIALTAALANLTALQRIYSVVSYSKRKK